MLPQLVKLKGIAGDILFPKWCVSCGREGDFICASCKQSLARIIPPVCPKCGQPRQDWGICHDCLNWQSSIDGIWSPFRFEGAVRQAIHQLKYHNIRALAGTLAALLADYLLSSPIPGELLVPVPLHSRRLRERGYNQSALLARELGKKTGLALSDNCLTRQKYTPPQVKTRNVEERLKNVVDAFICSGDVRGKRVLLIDDVSTTGATLDACAAALKSCGADSVWGLVVAREI